MILPAGLILPSAGCLNLKKIRVIRGSSSYKNHVFSKKNSVFARVLKKLIFSKISIDSDKGLGYSIVISSGSGVWKDTAAQESVQVFRSFAVCFWL